MANLASTTHKSSRTKESKLFRGFLSVLHPRAADAADLYVGLHKAAVLFGECHGVHDPEGFADKVIDSMQKRERTEQISNPRASTLSLARILLKEYRRKSLELPRQLTDAPLRAPRETQPLLPPVQPCLRRARTGLLAPGLLDGPTQPDIRACWSGDRWRERRRD